MTPRQSRRHIRCETLALTSLALWLAAPALARGELPLDLIWEAPAECPPVESVTEEVRRLLGRTQLDGTAVIRARAEVRRTEDGYAMRLDTKNGGAAGRRELSAPVCEELAEAAGLIIALAINPDALLDDSDSEDPDPASTAENASAAVAVEPTPASGPRDAEWSPASASTVPDTPAAPVDAPTLGTQQLLDLGATGSAAASFGRLPRAAFGLSIGAWLGASPIRFVLRATYWLPQQTGSGSADLRMYQLGVTPSVLYFLYDGRVSVACGSGFEVNVVRGSGIGLESPRTRTDLWLAPAAVVSSGYHVERGGPALHLTLAAVFPLRRAAWVADPGDQLFRASRAAFDVSTGVEIPF